MLAAAKIPSLLVLTKDDRINDRADRSAPVASIMEQAHQSRSYLTSKVRRGLAWPESAPHVHYSTERAAARRQLRRWIHSLCQTGDSGTCL